MILVSLYNFLILQYGDTPIHTAARYGHAGVARILVSAKCNTNLQNKVRIVLSFDSKCHMSWTMYIFSECNVIPMITFELLISEDNCSTEQKLYGRKSYFWCSFNHVKLKAKRMLQLHNLQIYSVSWAMYSYVLDNGVRHDNRHGQIPTELVFRIWN